MKMEKIIKNDVKMIKMFVWKRKRVYLIEWWLELEWFFNVVMYYEGEMLVVVGLYEDVLGCVGCVEYILYR